MYAAANQKLQLVITCHFINSMAHDHLSFYLAEGLEVNGGDCSHYGFFSKAPVKLF